MPKCKICGARIEDGVVVCPTCGAKVEGNTLGTGGSGTTSGTVKPRISSPTQTVKTTCPSCGAEIVGEHRFCPQCGVNLKEAAEEKPRQQTSSQNNMRCPSCGSLVQSGKRFCPDCGASLVASPKPQAMTVEDAMAKADAAYNAEDYQTMFSFMKYAADLGHSDAQCILGRMYEDGAGVEQDFQKAEEYYRLAAEQGDSDAQEALGKLARRREWVTGNIQIPTDKDELKSLVFLAAKTNSCNAMKTLLDTGFDASKSFDGLWDFRITPLGVAAIFDSADIARLLIQRGVPVKGLFASCGSYSNWDHTPLMIAVINNSLETAKVLLDAGADVNSSTVTGWTALKIAEKRGLIDMQRLLIQYGAKTHSVRSMLMAPNSLLASPMYDALKAGDIFLRENWERQDSD